MINKICRSCKVPQSLESFNSNKSKADGLQDECRKCDNTRTREYYKQNKTKMKSQIKAAAKKRQDKNRLWVCEYLESHPCVDCGATDIRVLEFDHQRDKITNISMMVDIHSLLSIQKEIDKCEVRCANCHRIKTALSTDNYKVKYLDKRSF